MDGQKCDFILSSALSESEVAVYCRGKGVHTSKIALWREASMQSNGWDLVNGVQLKSATDAPRKQTTKLEGEFLHKSSALAEAAALLVLGESLMPPSREDEDR